MHNLSTVCVWSEISDDTLEKKRDYNFNKISTCRSLPQKNWFLFLEMSTIPESSASLQDQEDGVKMLSHVHGLSRDSPGHTCGSEGSVARPRPYGEWMAEPAVGPKPFVSSYEIQLSKLGSSSQEGDVATSGETSQRDLPTARMTLVPNTTTSRPLRPLQCFSLISGTRPLPPHDVSVSQHVFHLPP